MARRALAVVSAVVVAAVAASCGGSGSGKDTGPTAYAKRTVTIDDVEIQITPARITDAGASFRIVFDTHAGSLDLNVADGATLRVDGTAWTSPRWSGDPPGGHHREGTLRFDSAGAADGDAKLVLRGLKAPVRANWRVQD